MLERDLYQCNGDFEITVICALQVERHAVEAFLDVKYETDGFLTRKSSWCAELGCNDMLLIRRTQDSWKRSISELYTIGHYYIGSI